MSLSNATIHNVRLDSHFTITSNKTPEDPRLSWAAKGLLWYVLSRSHDWKIFTAQLAEIYQGKDRGNGYDAIKKIVKELRTAGYVKYTKSRDSKGQWQHRYDVYPVPHSDFQKMFPEVVKPPLDEPPVVKPPIIPRTNINDDDDNAHTREEKIKEKDPNILITRDFKGREKSSCKIGLINYLRDNKYPEGIILEAIIRTEKSEEPISNVLKYVETICLQLQSQNSKKPQFKTKENIWTNKKNKPLKQKSKDMEPKTSMRQSETYKEPSTGNDTLERPFQNWRSLVGMN